MRRTTLIDKAFLLKKSPLFKDLDLDLLLSIAEKIQILEYKENHIIFNANQKAEHLFFIISGSVEVINLDQKSCAKLNENDFFGEESLFNERPREYTTKALSNALLFSLSRGYILKIIAECPSVALNLLRSFAEPIGFRGIKLK